MHVVEVMTSLPRPARLPSISNPQITRAAGWTAIANFAREFGDLNADQCRYGVVGTRRSVYWRVVTSQ